MGERNQLSYKIEGHPEAIKAYFVTDPKRSFFFNLLLLNPSSLRLYYLASEKISPVKTFPVA